MQSALDFHKSGLDAPGAAFQPSVVKRKADKSENANSSASGYPVRMNIPKPESQLNAHFSPILRFGEDISRRLTFNAMVGSLQPPSPG
ncbi:MAG: hypothetical protein L0H37_10515 [Nitrosospira sp.]|nr:hypothetical protein [Nitrosospira sp.]